MGFHLDFSAFNPLSSFFVVDRLKDNTMRLIPILYRANGLTIYVKQTSANSVKVVSVSGDGLEQTSDNTVGKVVDMLYNKYCIVKATNTKSPKKVV